MSCMPWLLYKGERGGGPAAAQGEAQGGARQRVEEPLLAPRGVGGAGFTFCTIILIIHPILFITR